MIEFVREFAETGFVSAHDALIPAAEYMEVYQIYDAIFFAEANRPARSLIHRASIAWLSDQSNTISYSHAPVGFEDRKGRPEKDNKTYFQYNSSFGSLLADANCLLKSGDLSELLSRLATIDELSRRIFFTHLKEIDCELNHKLSTTFGSLSKEDFPIVTKIIRYESNQRCATGVHFDKSVLTLLHHGSDMENDPFRICAPNKHASYDFNNMSAPRRLANSPESSVIGIVFPGMLFSLAGIQEIQASPHGVNRSLNTKETRHSIISFLLMPGMDLSGLETKAD